MLVQSRADVIDLLPALPDAWPAGRLAGVRVRGACTLDVTWQEGRPISLVLQPERDGTRTIRFGKTTMTARLSAGRRQVIDLTTLA
jgi:alpha-L-fucosidase 2